MKRFLSLLLFFTLPAFATVKIVAAENMYGDIAKTIGGKNVSVSSILHDPNQDPHLFSNTPATAKAFADADILIVNGADYDPWAVKLAKNSHAIVLNVADLKPNCVGADGNPHLWYKLACVNTLATQLTDTLEQKDRQNKKEFKKNLKAFQKEAKQLQTQIDQIKKDHPHTTVTATEPVVGYVFEALGFTVKDKKFQRSIMNDTAPSANDRAALIDNLTHRRVALLAYNQQVTDPTTQGIRELAQNSGVRIVGVSELMPSGKNYFTWYQSTLDAIAASI